MNGRMEGGSLSSSDGSVVVVGGGVRGFVGGGGDGFRVCFVSVFVANESSHRYRRRSLIWPTLPTERCQTECRQTERCETSPFVLVPAHPTTTKNPLLRERI